MPMKVLSILAPDQRRSRWPRSEDTGKGPALSIKSSRYRSAPRYARSSIGFFQITPDADLNIMKEKQSLSEITTQIIEQLSPILTAEAPDIVLVHGDTTTTFAAALSAYYQQIPIGHVEAGLRTWDKYSPFPEEMNRQLVDTLSDLCFAPTKESSENLQKENHPQEQIFVTGNTAIDAMKYTLKEDYSHPALTAPDKTRLLVTMHRRENIGAPMTSVFQALAQLAKEKKS